MTPPDRRGLWDERRTLITTECLSRFPAKLTIMNKIMSILAVVSAVAALAPANAAAQEFAAAGTRAAGMGGAFVGVADDATAIYWNPAGLAAGSYFSLVLDGGAGKAAPDLSAKGGNNSSFFMGLAMPALGLGYYRLQASSVRPPLTLLSVDGTLPSRNLSAAAEVRLDTLVTHHGGVTLVQSLWEGIAIGTTLKLVRGLAASNIVAVETAEEALNSEAAEIFGRATNKFDLDVGLMAAGGPLKVGVTVRNLREPGFEAAGEQGELVLERQARAGLSYAVAENWIAAADVDLLRIEDAFGERRDIAVGTEGRLTPRVLVRAGATFNTVGGEGAERRAFSVGGSYAARASVFVDGHFTTGNERAGHQWGLAARFVY
jgi:hypothetical protein